MTITLEHSEAQLQGVSATITGRDGTFYELVQQFKQAALAIGFHPNTVSQLQCAEYPSVQDVAPTHDKLIE